MTRQELILIIGMTAVTFGVRYPVMAITGQRFRDPPLQSLCGSLRLLCDSLCNVLQFST